MEAVLILGVVVVISLAAAFGEPFLIRWQARRAEDKRLEAVFAVLRLFSEDSRRRRR